MPQAIRAPMMAAAAALLLAGTSCGNINEDSQVLEGAVLGDTLPGTDPAHFAEAKDAFNASENAADGLGPIFNERGCGTCHQNGAIGGAGQQVEARFGRITNGTFDGMESVGGSLRQLFGIGGFNVGGLNCNSGTDANPAAGRHHLRRPSDHAAVRPGAGRLAARLAFRHAGQPRARRDSGHRQPRHDRAPQRGRQRRRTPGRRASAVSAGRRACRTWASSRLTPI